MALRIVEFFGYAPQDASADATVARRGLQCPFIGERCTKTLNDGLVSGACTVQQVKSGPIICCPKRLYGGAYKILQDTADAVFAPGVPFVPGNRTETHPRKGK